MTREFNYNPLTERQPLVTSGDLFDVTKGIDAPALR